MSGGSLNYACNLMQDTADSIRGRASKPLHVAFADHVEKVAEALHDLEWVWSLDKSPGDEDEAIRACIAPDAEIKAATDALKVAIFDAQKLIKAAQ